MRLRPVLISAAAAASLGGLVPAGAAAALDACAGVGPTTTVARDGGWLESSAFDGSGRLIYDDWLGGKVRALDTPASKPRSLGHLRWPGGIDQAAGGLMVIGDANGTGSLFGGSSVVALDPSTGAKSRVASGLAGVNGLARSADGTIYASDTASGWVGRVAADGTVTRFWWHSSGGPTGLAVSADGRTLYAAMSQTLRVVAIDTTTRAARTVYRASVVAPVADGLTIDARGRLYVSLYLAGEVDRIDPSTGTACRLARGLTSPTSIALAEPGGAFDPASAYVTTYGSIKRIAAAVPST